jgi:hypothetical protein
MALSKTPTTALSDWSFQDKHVQQNLTGGDFIGSHGCLLCATAPRMTDLTDDGSAFNDSNPNTQNIAENGAIEPGDLSTNFALPIGVVDTGSMQQDRQMAQIFELGSKRSYILASRTTGVMSLARVFYKGPNLLRMLYAYYPEAKINTSIQQGASTEGTGNSITNTIQLNADSKEKLPGILDLPGYSNVFFNLNSDLFSQPFGIVLYIKNNNSKEVAAVYLEECYIQNHVLNMSANNIIVAENTTLRFERVVPIKVREVASGSNATVVNGMFGLANSLGFPAPVLK